VTVQADILAALARLEADVRSVAHVVSVIHENQLFGTSVPPDPPEPPSSNQTGPQSATSGTTVPSTLIGTDVTPVEPSSPPVGVGPYGEPYGFHVGT